MKLRTQFIITMIGFAVVLLVVSGLEISTDRRVARTRVQQNIATSIALGASELGYLANDYLVYREPQQLGRWESRYLSFSDEISSLNLETPSQESLLNNIRSSQMRMEEVFESIVSTVTATQGAPVDIASFQIAWSRMAVQRQSLITDATLLSELLTAEADEIRELNNLISLLMVTTVGIFFVINFFLIQRRALNSIARLRAGTVEVGSGNLDFTIDESKKDEIGDLARAFNLMSANLKKVTASKADLETEINERLRVEDELQLALTRLERSNADLELFAYVASHDLQEPLRMVASYVKLLESRYGEKLDDDAKEFIGYAAEGADRMQVMIRDLLAYSRVGSEAARRRYVDSNLIIDDALENVRLSMTESGVELIRGELPVVFADGAQLTQLFQNLIGNAIKFRSQEQPRITISAEKQEDDWVFSVADNGIGIDREHARRIFVIFQRLHSRSEYPGTGIGLAICKKIVEHHGGRIWVESELGRGTEFKFTIPASEKLDAGNC